MLFALVVMAEGLLLQMTAWWRSLRKPCYRVTL